MPTETIPRVGDDTERRLRVTRALLADAYDGLDQLERDVGDEVRAELEAVPMLVALALDVLPAEAPQARV